MRKIIIMLVATLIFGCKKEKVTPIDDGKRTIYIESYCQNNEHLININNNVFWAWKDSRFNNTSTMNVGDSVKIYLGSGSMNGDSSIISLFIKQSNNAIIYNNTQTVYNNTPLFQFTFVVK